MRTRARTDARTHRHTSIWQMTKGHKAIKERDLKAWRFRGETHTSAGLASIMNYSRIHRRLNENKLVFIAANELRMKSGRLICTTFSDMNFRWKQVKYQKSASEERNYCSGFLLIFFTPIWTSNFIFLSQSISTLYSSHDLSVKNWFDCCWNAQSLNTHHPSEA